MNARVPALLRRARLPALAVAAARPPVGAARAEAVDTMRVASLEPAALMDNTTDAPGPQITARVDLSEQRMYVYVGEQLEYTFKVSTGRKGYGTPTGRWNAAWLSPKHRSRKYNNAPMPWAVFFYQGYAVHGTTDVGRLGRPASHGCIRLHPDNAKTFFSLVQKNGKENTLISIVR